ncbi:hypothetical protein HQ496_08110 [bacterium]|nr:hypothetical protein [bacterium]
MKNLFTSDFTQSVPSVGTELNTSGIARFAFNEQDFFAFVRLIVRISVSGQDLQAIT